MILNINFKHQHHLTYSYLTSFITNWNDVREDIYIQDCSVKVIFSRLNLIIIPNFMVFEISHSILYIFFCSLTYPTWHHFCHGLSPLFIPRNVRFPISFSYDRQKRRTREFHLLEAQGNPGKPHISNWTWVYVKEAQNEYLSLPYTEISNISSIKYTCMRVIELRNCLHHRHVIYIWSIWW